MGITKKIHYDIGTQLQEWLDKNHLSVVEFEKTFWGRYKNIVHTAKHLGIISIRDREKILAIINEDEKGLSANRLNGSENDIEKDSGGKDD